MITARMTNRELTGTFDGIDAQGNLVLKTAKSRENIPAAEVYF